MKQHKSRFIPNTMSHCVVVQDSFTKVNRALKDTQLNNKSIFQEG